MKNTIIILGMLITIFPTLLFGQKYKIDSTGWYYGYGKIKLKNGATVEDTLNFSFAEYKLRMITKKEDFGGIQIQKQLTPKMVEWFTIKDIRFVSARPSNSLSDEFMIQLLPENYKIQIYKRYELSEDRTQILEIFYVKMPGKEKVVNIETDLSLMPFHKKVSVALSDCPALADKISKKQENYKVEMLSAPKDRVNLFLRVAEEYEQCK